MRRVALLRGINVGGSGRLKMEALRGVASALGFEDIETLGASGNLVYRSGRAPDQDRAALVDALAGVLDKEPVVIVRDGAELAAIVAEDPFHGQDVPDKWRFIAFQQGPSNAVLDLPVTPVVARREREVCYVMHEADRKALDAPKHIERALGTSVTVRNWNVVRKLADLAA